MAQIDSKVALIARVYIWFYRILGFTFGGVSIDSENKLFVNKYLKYYGFFWSIVATLYNITGLIVLSTSDQILAIYKSGQVIAYCLCFLIGFLSVFQIIVNIWYLNLKGIKFMEIFVQYDLNIKKNQIIIFIIWICHIITPFVGVLYTLYTSNSIKSSNPMIVVGFSIFTLGSYYGAWAVPFLTWIISILFLELLKGIKQSLIEKQNNNKTGICLS
jgi:hypothetical protein